MKKSVILVLVAIMCCCMEVNAQGFLKGLADKAKEKLKEKVENKVDRSVDEAIDDVLSGKKSKKKSKKKTRQNDNEDSNDYSEEPSSEDYEESSYEETNNDASDEGGNITQVILTPWLEMMGMSVEGVQQIALVTESQQVKIFEGLDKLTGDVQEQVLKRKLNENNKAVISEIVRKAKSYSLGNRLYSAVYFISEGDLIVVSTSQKPVSDVRNVRGEWGAIDKKGNVIIPLKHFNFTRNASWMDALLFVDKEHGKIGAYHLNGKLRIPFVYEYIQPEKTKHKYWFVTYENGKNVLYDENMNKKLTADNIEIVFGTLNGKDDTYIYTYNGAGSAKVYKNYDENLNLIK